jgi:23S rRNA pseudouridine1911/1915/1917 synthase
VRPSSDARSQRLVVLRCDNHLLAVAKPAGLPTMRDASGDESLLDRARAWVKREYAKPGAAWLGVVHRLDRPVSGVVLFARTSKAAARLSAQFRSRRVAKVYWAVVRRWSASEDGRIEQWLAKDRARNTVRAFDEARPGTLRAATRWRVLARASDRVLLELQPETGRPHQLRVALASLGAPILGDVKYGARAPLADQSIALHARSLALDHPTRAEVVELVAEPPQRDFWRW